METVVNLKSVQPLHPNSKTAGCQHDSDGGESPGKCLEKQSLADVAARRVSQRTGAFPRYMHTVSPALERDTVIIRPDATELWWQDWL